MNIRQSSLDGLVINFIEKYHISNHLIWCKINKYMKYTFFCKQNLPIRGIFSEFKICFIKKKTWTNQWLILLHYLRLPLNDLAVCLFHARRNLMVWKWSTKPGESGSKIRSIGRMWNIFPTELLNLRVFVMLAVWGRATAIML